MELKKQNDETIDQFFGKLIQSVRNDLGLNQTQFGSQFGLDQNQISRIERGLQPAPRFLIFIALDSKIEITKEECVHCSGTGFTLKKIIKDEKTGNPRRAKGTNNE